jgi:GMP synthase-like glutamine amidotransferase
VLVVSDGAGRTSTSPWWRAPVLTAADFVQRRRHAPCSPPVAFTGTVTIRGDYGRDAGLPSWKAGFMRVVVVRHHEEDSAGFVGAVFEELGAVLDTRLFPDGGPLPELDGVDHVVLLGAAWSVYDDDPRRAWIADELAWLRRADQGGVPVLGICFGAQALAAALGGRVEAAPRSEIGWVTVDSLGTGLIPAGPWLEFHGDRFLPPPRAQLLARNTAGVQAFTAGAHLAVQFHPEADAAQLQAWLDAGGREMAERAGTDPERFLAQTLAQEPAARRRARALVAAALLTARRSAS